jgi:hypothetical protein
VGDFRPGELVPHSGIYRVYHEAHRLMHEATLLINEPFPCCKQCGPKVRFQLIRWLRDDEVLPFRSGEILQEFVRKTKTKEAS